MSIAKRILVIMIVLSGCTAKHKESINKFSILFVYDAYTKVDFNKRKIKTAYFNTPDTIRFSNSEEKMIERSFYSNKISELKEDIDCFSDKVVIMPTVNYQVQIFKEGKLQSITIVNYQYNVDDASIFSKKYKPASFVTDLRKILEHNADFKHAIRSLRQYEKEHHLFRL